jgi:hypothetical protein
MSLDYLGRLDSELTARQERIKQIIAPSNETPIMAPGQAPWERSGGLTWNERRAAILADLTAEPDQEPVDDDAPDQRYEVTVQTSLGQSKVYMMASSIGEVKRAMRNRQEYHVLDIKAMGVPSPVGLDSIKAALAKADALRKTVHN